MNLKSFEEINIKTVVKGSNQHFNHLFVLISFKTNANKANNCKYSSAPSCKHLSASANFSAILAFCILSSVSEEVNLSNICANQFLRKWGNVCFLAFISTLRRYLVKNLLSGVALCDNVRDQSFNWGHDSLLNT